MINPITIKSTYESPYFKDMDAEFIFYLLETDGSQRCNKLGIKRNHYGSVERATEWRDNILSKLQFSTHPRLQEAIAKLDKLYQNMLPDENDTEEYDDVDEELEEYLDEIRENFGKE